MKFFIDQSLFKNALQHVLSVVEKKTPSPILSHILIEVEKSTIKLTATNLDIAIIESVPLANETLSSFSFAAPAHMLNDIVAKLPKNCEIEITIDQLADGKPASTFSLNAEKINYRLNYLPKDLFPNIRPQNYPYSLKISKSHFYDLLHRTRFSVADEDVRTFLSGIFLHPVLEGSEKMICAVATDGHRLAKIVAKHLSLTEDFPGIILPSKTTDILCRLLASQEEELPVTIEISPVSIHMHFGNISVISKLVDAQYPDYRQAIPEGPTQAIYINREQLMKAADRIALVADPLLKAINAQLQERLLCFSVPGTQQGSGSEEIEVEESQLSSLHTVFNATYLLDATRHLKDEIIRLEVSDPESPILLKGKDDTSALYVLMPIVN